MSKIYDLANKFRVKLAADSLFGIQLPIRIKFVKEVGDYGVDASGVGTTPQDVYDVDGVQAIGKDFKSADENVTKLMKFLLDGAMDGKWDWQLPKEVGDEVVINSTAFIDEEAERERLWEEHGHQVDSLIKAYLKREGPVSIHQIRDYLRKMKAMQASHNDEMLTRLLKNVGLNVTDEGIVSYDGRVDES